jgi:hypothetical protein
VHLALYSAGIAALTAEDPYAGLILSMHGAGIYKNRYGLQPDHRMRFVDEMSTEVQTFIADQEEGFQGRLADLGIGEEEAWRAFRLMQVWDRLSLYLCLRDIEGGETEAIPSVPFGTTAGEIRLLPLGGGVVHVDPWPFASSAFEVAFERRVVPKMAWENDAAFRASFFTAPAEQVAVRLVRTTASLGPIATVGVAPPRDV